MKVKLIDVCDIQYGYAFDSKCFIEDESYMPLIRIRDVKRGFSETYFSGTYSDEYIINSGDLLIGMDGEFNIARWKSRSALLNQRVCKITAKPEVCEEYIRFILSVKLKEIERRTAFVTVKHLSAKELNKLELDIPEYEIQVKIAEILQKIECILDNRNSELEHFDDLIKSRFVEMFGDLKTNPKNWQQKNLLEVAKIDTTMVKDYGKYADYPHIGIDSIEKNTGRLFGFRTVSEDNVISGKYLFTDKHIIYSKIRPNLNKVALPDFEGLCSADAYPILADEKRCLRLYLGYVMRSEYFLDYILPFSRRANMPKVNKEQLSGFCFPLPDIQVQKQFATFVEHIDKLKVKVQQSLDETQILFDSLMQKHFG